MGLNGLGGGGGGGRGATAAPRRRPRQCRRHGAMGGDAGERVATVGRATRRGSTCHHSSLHHMRYRKPSTEPVILKRHAFIISATTSRSGESWRQKPRSTIGDHIKDLSTKWNNAMLFTKPARGPSGSKGCEPRWRLCHVRSDGGSQPTSSASLTGLGSAAETFLRQQGPQPLRHLSSSPARFAALNSWTRFDRLGEQCRAARATASRGARPLST